MKFALTPEQEEAKSAFRKFVDKEIAPRAAQFDQEERLPPELIGKIVQQGYWGTILPVASGGAGMDMITYGLLTEEIGRGCASVRNLLGVQDMVAAAVMRWGSEEQKAYWLPRMASGETIAAFAMTEPEVGSDARNVQTTATRAGDDFLLNGRKKWISFGQMATLFLLFAQCEGEAVALLVERDTPGLTVKPITGMLGFRASMLAALHLDECRVPAENLVGPVGFGFSHVASAGLDLGRYSTAWGCVGLAQACLDASLRYANERRQFGVYLREHQLIQRLLTNMITNVKAARLLCYQAGYLKNENDPGAILETSIAKYFASTTAMQIASDAVQIHGAQGCGPEYPVQRHLRDAKIMEIIEGSTQIQQLVIARYGQYSNFSR